MNDDLISRSALLAALLGEGWILPAKVRWMIERAPAVDAVPVRWIPVTERMPDNEVDVLICVERRHYSDPGKFIRFVVKAFHTDGLKNTEDSAYAWSTDYTDMEYNEESDVYIIPEGWWECVEYGEEFCAVSDFVTHWMPLPKPPKEG